MADAHKDKARQRTARRQRVQGMPPGEIPVVVLEGMGNVQRVAQKGTARDHMAMLDRAMFLKACEGNVAAARLVYARLLAEAQDSTLPDDGLTLEAMEEILLALKIEKKGGETS